MPLPDERLERIVFVTRRFGELRGLVSASTGAFLILGVVAWSLLPGDTRNVFQGVAFFASFGTMWVMAPVHNYYARWFGRAPLLRTESSLDSQPVEPDTTGALLMQMALAIDYVRGFVHPGGGSVAAAALAGYSLWVLVRDGRHRPYYVIGLAAGVAGLVITAAMPAGFRLSSHRDAAVTVPYVLTYAVVGLSLVVVGLLDHRLLARAMRPATQDTPARMLTDIVASQARAMLAGTSLMVVIIYISIGGWPENPLWLYWALYLTLAVIGLAVQARQLRRIKAQQRLAEASRQARRDRRLESKVAALRGQDEPPAENEPGFTRVAPPAFDLSGHVGLPIAMAAGALADIMLRGSGAPSLLALALAASHLRIALRDWPSRWYYLLGTVAASVSAVQFMFVASQQVLDWTVWFLILVCTAMLVEGLLDLRLARAGGNAHFSKEHHDYAL